MSVSIPSTVSQTYSLESMTNHIRQRLNAYQELSGALKAGKTDSANQTFSSMLQSRAATASDSPSQTTQSVLVADIKALQEALQSGDTSAIEAATAQLQTDIQATMPDSEKAQTFAADLKALREALQAGDPSAIKAAVSQLQTDIRATLPNSEKIQTFADDLKALRKAIQDGDPSAIKTAVSQLQTDIRAALPNSEQAQTFAADFKILREALQAGDSSAIEAAVSQLQTDIQAVITSARQNAQTHLNSAASLNSILTDDDLKLLISSIASQNSQTTSSQNGLQHMIQNLASAGISTIGFGTSILTSLLGTSVNTSA